MATGCAWPDRRRSEPACASDPGDADRRDVAAFLERRTEEAFLALYRRHAPAMYGLALRLLGGRRSDADDVLQEAWLRAIRRLPEFRWASALRTWLCGLTINCCRERFREPLFEELTEAVEVGATEAAIDVERALAGLAPGYRAVLILHDLEGYTHAEIAAALRIEAGTSKSQLSRARQLLRDRLGRGAGREI